MTAVRSPGMRTVLLYAQDRQGLGHITRSLTIARHLLARYPNAVAYLATKSALASHFGLPDRFDYIKLPTRLRPAAQRTALEEKDAGARPRLGARGPRAARRQGRVHRRPARTQGRAARHAVRIRAARHHGRSRAHSRAVARAGR